MDAVNILGPAQPASGMTPELVKSDPSCSVAESLPLTLEGTKMNRYGRDTFLFVISGTAVG